jgi:hypothetical protein
LFGNLHRFLIYDGVDSPPSTVTYMPTYLLIIVVTVVIIPIVICGEEKTSLETMNL